MNLPPFRVAVLGLGDIATKAYLPNLQAMRRAQRPGEAGGLSPVVEVVAAADLDLDRAASVGEQFDIPRVGGVEAVLADASIDAVLNLTRPAAHVAVSLQALRAGKHVYVEKPIAPDADGAGTVLAEAARQGLKVGCAPDTVLSPAHTRCRALIESGAIGRPVAATGFMLCPGHESWHPDPAFYYQPGGGPLFDMGPYYLTALVRMLGPIARVSGAAGVQVTDRAVGRGPRRGEAIAVQTPDHVSATLEFASGAVGTLVTSFATRHAGHLTHSSGPEGAALPITVFGTRGTLRVPDPNCFEGTVCVRGVDDSDWRVETFDDAGPAGGRGLGVYDLAEAIRADREPACSGALAAHVVEAMQGVLDSAETGQRVTLQTRP